MYTLNASRFEFWKTHTDQRDVEATSASAHAGDPGYRGFGMVKPLLPWLCVLVGTARMGGMVGQNKRPHRRWTRRTVSVHPTWKAGEQWKNVLTCLDPDGKVHLALE